MPDPRALSSIEQAGLPVAQLITCGTFSLKREDPTKNRSCHGGLGVPRQANASLQPALARRHVGATYNYLLSAYCMPGAVPAAGGGWLEKDPALH